MDKKTAATQFRKLLARNELIVMPGAFNALSALQIEQAGFSAYYLSGAGLANAVFGRPDIGLTTLDEATEHARRVTRAVTIPAISDADTGFGGPREVAKTVRAFEAAGVVGIHLEDQHEDKRCGHLDGKELIAAEEMEAKIAAATAARTHPDFLLIARTDACAVEGLAGAITRARRYVKAGADAIFPEALTSPEEFRAFRKAIDAPLLANMTEFGKTPYVSVKEFSDLGYNMMIFPMTLLRRAAFAMQETLIELRQRGTQKEMLDRMQTRAELYELLKYKPK